LRWPIACVRRSGSRVPALHSSTSFVDWRSSGARSWICRSRSPRRSNRHAAIGWPVSRSRDCPRVLRAVSRRSLGIIEPRGVRLQTWKSRSRIGCTTRDKASASIINEHNDITPVHVLISPKDGSLPHRRKCGDARRGNLGWPISQLDRNVPTIADTDAKIDSAFSTAEGSSSIGIEVHQARGDQREALSHGHPLVAVPTALRSEAGQATRTTTRRTRVPHGTSPPPRTPRPS